jgi:hypothetical protein
MRPASRPAGLLVGELPGLNEVQARQTHILHRTRHTADIPGMAGVHQYDTNIVPRHTADIPGMAGVHQYDTNIVQIHGTCRRSKGAQF